MSKFARGGQYEPLWDTVMLLSEDSVSDVGQVPQNFMKLTQAVENRQCPSLLVGVLVTGKNRLWRCHGPCPRPQNVGVMIWAVYRTSYGITILDIAEIICRCRWRAQTTAPGHRRPWLKHGVLSSRASSRCFFQMCAQQQEGGRGHAVDAGGLGERGWLVCLELFAHLRR